MDGFIEVPAAVGKVIREMWVYADDPDFGRDVLLKFTDGSEVTVTLEVKRIASATHYWPHPGGIEVIGEYVEPPDVAG
jgi:hypothetical protein